MREPETLTPRQERERMEALARRGRQIQEQWNRRRQSLAPGTEPKTRGIGPADREQAQRNIEARAARKQAEIARIRAEETAKRASEAQELKIAAKIADYENQLRLKAGLPVR